MTGRHTGTPGSTPSLTDSFKKSTADRGRKKTPSVLSIIRMDPSGRGDSKARSVIVRHSFIPHAIKLLNAHHSSYIYNKWVAMAKSFSPLYEKLNDDGWLHSIKP